MCQSTQRLPDELPASIIRVMLEKTLVIFNFFKSKQTFSSIKLQGTVRSVEYLAKSRILKFNYSKYDTNSLKQKIFYIINSKYISPQAAGVNQFVDPCIA